MRCARLLYLTACPSSKHSLWSWHLRYVFCLVVSWIATEPQEVGPNEAVSKHDWLRFMRRVELVILHDATCQRPTGTLEWLQQRPLLARHHHVRLTIAQDVARLCRWIAGKAVGLVLSGGYHFVVSFAVTRASRLR
jgi:hypothetical protein